MEMELGLGQFFLPAAKGRSEGWIFTDGCRDICQPASLTALEGSKATQEIIAIGHGDILRRRILLSALTMAQARRSGP